MNATNLLPTLTLLLFAGYPIAAWIGSKVDRARTRSTKIRRFRRFRRIERDNTDNDRNDAA
ncbi:MAG: hypothetical protein R3F34_17485 [Planctomycetota bacterium]